MQPTAYEISFQALNIFNINSKINVLKLQIRIKNLKQGYRKDRRDLKPL
jgi:hypothetical protein